MVLRKKVAEAGVNYDQLSGIYNAQKEDAKEVSCFSLLKIGNAFCFVDYGPQFCDVSTWFSPVVQQISACHKNLHPAYEGGMFV